MALRDRLRRLEHAAEEETILIPQRDGTVKRFPPSSGEEALINLMMDRLAAGEDATPEHPMIEAVRNSSEPKWAGSVCAANDPAG